MAEKKFVVGCFDDEAVLFPAVKKVRKAGYKIHDVYTPFPVHGLDPCYRYPGNQPSYCRIYLWYYRYNYSLKLYELGFYSDWPLNIGGKPHFALPALIPITFELTVLFSAVGMVLTFCYLCQMAPFVKKHHFHPRATDDLFVMVIECTAKTNEAEVRGFLNSAGANEINVQKAETGWWLGTYDKDKKPFEDKKH